MTTRLKKGLAVLFTSGLLGIGIGVPTAAAQNQTGLVNVSVGNVAVVAPIQVAANVCDVDVIVLASQVADLGSTTCTSRNGQTVTVSQL
jgi:hypothetical protein